MHGKLANILPATNILHKLIPEGIISTGDIEEISDKPSLRDKVLFILTSLKADAKNSFNVLRNIMEVCGNDYVRDIVIDVRRTLMTGEVTVNDHTYLHTCITTLQC